MIGWAILMTYLVGWIASTPVALQILMTQRHGCRGRNRTKYIWDYESHCRSYCQNGCWTSVGEIRDRNLGDALLALSAASVWFLAIVPVLTLRWTPLTDPELRRRSEEQAKRIETLERQLNIELEG